MIPARGGRIDLCIDVEPGYITVISTWYLHISNGMNSPPSLVTGVRKSRWQVSGARALST